MSEDELNAIWKECNEKFGMTVWKECNEKFGTRG